MSETRHGSVEELLAETEPSLLGFYTGATLPAPAALLEGTGAKLRHVKVRSVEDAEAAAVRELIVAALAERRDALGR